MVERVYSHLGQVRHRSKVVEYRIEQYEEALVERLTALRRAPQLSGTNPLAPRPLEAVRQIVVGCWS
jgi:hypothetical protein